MFRQAGIDTAVLEELRAIRAEIHELAEKVGQAATRDDLADYVTREAFDAHVNQHKERVADWRFWLPYALTALMFVLYVMQDLGVRLVAGR
ncbi:MAG: hypothetical protein OJF49_003233 [Ktedonobacterales bacterium]|jgi:hypothetical protein|nr:MAG: hypothetical protein OJF49_003233 [Ktedonobacterales bacterium]